MNHSPATTWTVYRSRISYFSGKLEAYLKYKAIAHVLVDLDRDGLNRVYRHTGVKKMPAMESPDGNWLFDTTPMIAWLEAQYGGVPVLPDDPALAFVALLLEDYGDEWLWRPAMWWRWVPVGSRLTLGRTIGAEFVSEKVAQLAGRVFAQRQMREWLRDDGVDAHNEGLVRDMLFREFEFLEPQFDRHPFLLGSHPSVADYGYFGSMFRHFGNDPDPAEVMRMQAPNTYEWLARLWNAKTARLGDKPVWAWPQGDHWQPLLDRIANDYLPYLAQNAAAYLRGRKRFDFTGRNIDFRGTKTTHYRVWCHEVLQRRYASLDAGDRARVDALFQSVGGLSALTAGGIIDSGMNDFYRLPVSPAAPAKRRIRTSVLWGAQPRN